MINVITIIVSKHRLAFLANHVKYMEMDVECIWDGTPNQIQFLNSLTAEHESEQWEVKITREL